MNRAAERVELVFFLVNGSGWNGCKLIELKGERVGRIAEPGETRWQKYEVKEWQKRVCMNVYVCTCKVVQMWQ